MAYNHLFSPVKIGSVEIPNRIALMPMGVLSPRMMNRDASYTKDGADYYIERAKGGTGLIITGMAPIPPGEFLPSIVNNPATYTENTKYLADGIHRYGSKVFIMISAMSGRSGTPGGPAPSATPNVWDPREVQREMTVDEIHQYVEWFAIGAKAAKDAGIDGVEIHAVHEGYLLDQFAISSFNKRTDEYGGSLENRLRFPTEIVQAIKAKCGKDFPVSLRYSVKSYTKAFNRGAVPGEEFEEFGRDYEESKKAARMLQEAGYDMLDCDNGTYDAYNQVQAMQVDGSPAVEMTMKNTLLTNNTGNHVEYADLAAGTHTVTVTSTDPRDDGEVLHDVLLVAYDSAYGVGGKALDQVYEAANGRQPSMLPALAVRTMQ